MESLQVRLLSRDVGTEAEPGDCPFLEDGDELEDQPVISSSIPWALGPELPFGSPVDQVKGEGHPVDDELVACGETVHAVP